MWCNPSGAIKVVQPTHSIICIICVMQSLWRRVCGAICAVQSKWRDRYNAIYHVWGGARSDARRKKSNAKKMPPRRRRRAPDGGDVIFSHLSGAREQGAQSPSPPARLRDIMRAGLRASCDEDARPRLPFWKWPATGRGKSGGVGRGNGEPVRETEKHARGEIWVEKSTPQHLQKHSPDDPWRVEKFHSFITTFSPPYHRTRRQTGPPTTSTTRNRHLAH